MAQMIRENDVKNRERRGSFKFNVAAPEFVPTLPLPAQLPITSFLYPCFPSIDGTNGSWIYVADQEIANSFVLSKLNEKIGSTQINKQQQQQQPSEIVISEEIKRKIIKQAEYMFSDMSMLANETLVKHVSKDPQGYVPINFVSTLKKLKSLNISNQTVAQALRSSSKLVVSSDSKMVKRKSPFTEKEKEELQSIRICQPQEHNASRSNKTDVVVSHKLHALVEYENAETAEKAAERLNDEGNWRKGMRVRLMLKRSPKTVAKSRKPEIFDACIDDNGSIHHSPEDAPRNNTSETESDDNSRKSWTRNWAKTKQRPLQGTRSLPIQSSHLMGFCLGQQPMKGPRMPDGTRGFTMGRGKPLVVQAQSS
ncbi:RNA-binding protein [Striga asiatica]|uniref:RNA-binding protein n=1 Tax=Striga asiatica TaxID=4170 RepID=A0A5A7QXV3_STRAF|nr:RNA-binding protein [Striga asiatica]